MVACSGGGPVSTRLKVGLDELRGLSNMHDALILFFGANVTSTTRSTEIFSQIMESK